MVAVAVKATEVPEQIVVAGDEVIVTAAVGEGDTSIIITLDTVALPAAQPEPGISIQVTESPFNNAEFVKVSAFVPTGRPFTNH